VVSYQALLRKQAQLAHEQGVKNVHLLLAATDSVGEMICQGMYACSFAVLLLVLF
jgi:hypothetical protein